MKTGEMGNFSVESLHWHPVAESSEITGSKPSAAALMNQPLVLWRFENTGTVQAWADQCPHRGAQLSLGKVTNGRLECPYHGWQFAAGTGRCALVPSMPDFVPPASHAARTFEVAEKYGLVWVRLAGRDAAESVDLPDLPEFSAETDAALRKLNCGPYDVATSAPRLVENFLDMAHFGFVHEAWLGDRNHTAIENYEVQATPNGLIATGCKAWQPQSSIHAVAPALVEYRYEVTAPYAAVLTKIPDAKSLGGALAGSAFQESIALFIAPLTPETSRVWFRLAVADFAAPAQQLRDFQNTIFQQDKPVLESQRPRCLPLQSTENSPKEVHVVTDKASAMYRKHLRQLGITFGVC